MVQHKVDLILWQAGILYEFLQQNHELIIHIFANYHLWEELPHLLPDLLPDDISSIYKKKI
jgi:hypothetical protein